MTIRKRFIAGAVCPSCQQQDTLAMWHEADNDVVECVHCGYQMRKNDQQLLSTAQAQQRHYPQQQIIEMFHPD